VAEFERVPIEVRIRHDLSEEILASVASLWTDAGMSSPDEDALAELGRCAGWLAQAFELDAELLVLGLADTILRSQRDSQGVRW